MKTDKQQEWTPQVGDVVEVVLPCDKQGERYSITDVSSSIIFTDIPNCFGWAYKGSLKLLIPSKTALAIAGSVRKWLDMVYRGGVDEGKLNCPLCSIFFTYFCKECPIKLKTGESRCRGTPYEEWDFHQHKEHNGIPAKATCPECSKLALDLANWIGELLPRTTFNLIKKEYEVFMEKKEVTKECNTCRFGEISCFDIVGRCSESYPKWQPKDPATCPTCKQPLPIKQEYCCGAFANGVTKPFADIRFAISKNNKDRWGILGLFESTVYYCPFCGKHPIPPVKEIK